ncbi:nuclear transport factor 2 family protein [Chryseobacterium indoltheticum]|uniref:Nuclear transport factor 2 family protein n=1 Tax=Chryseobacterium indoltheticum TaxID=254 RepID=A0A3G6N1H2_9FLAO|nr:nuclear transport factor 2 family protein [Chryseobacterium indoltheticum]AZA61860.1 nuclear transport factor 2 family protein [Chryseobacterium indoltheticum]
MKILLSIFLFCFVFGFSQNYSKDEKAVLLQVKKLDSLMMKNDVQIVDLFCSDVSFGHSNSWIQNLDDFKKDFTSKKVSYKEITQLEISELKQFKNTVSIRRSVKVTGLYKNQDFETKLALLEIWLKKKSAWKLWSRQSVEIKP